MVNVFTPHFPNNIMSLTFDRSKSVRVNITEPTAHQLVDKEGEIVVDNNVEPNAFKIIQEMNEILEYLQVWVEFVRKSFDITRVRCILSQLTGEQATPYLAQMAVSLVTLRHSQVQARLFKLTVDKARGLSNFSDEMYVENIEPLSKEQALSVLHASRLGDSASASSRSDESTAYGQRVDVAPTTSAEEEEQDEDAAIVVAD